MTISVQDLMRTEYYHPALNSAVFDGPVRIYFNQSQEALALKLYFYLQKEVEKILLDYGGSWYFVVLLYPQEFLYNEKVHEVMLAGDKKLFYVKTFGGDKLVLAHCNLSETQFPELCEGMRHELLLLTKTHDSRQLSYVV